MTDTAAQALLVDHLGRIRELVRGLTDGLDDAVATFRPDAEADTVAWLLWHLTRVVDDHVAALAYAGQVADDELARVVDDRWDPPVTAGVRLVSLLGDALQHLGQAAYVRGLAERAGVR